MHLEEKSKILSQIEESTKRYALSEQKSEIDGMPIAIKANFNCAEFGTIEALADSSILRNYSSPFSATVVRQLVAAGAILTGLTRLDEFGMGSYGSNTWDNTRVTQVPFESGLLPGGSSSGSAVAVQAHTCKVAIGTDTGGSVRIPAAFCGLYGFKPSYGMISRFGVVEYAGSLDTVGLMSRSIDPLDNVFKVLSKGIDGNDSTHKTREELLQDPVYPVQPKIGIIEDFLFTNKLKEKVDLISGQSNTPVVPVQFDFDLLTVLAAYYSIAVAECSSNLSKYTGFVYGSSLDQMSTNYFEHISKNRSTFFGKEVQKRILTGNFVLSKSLNNDIMCYEKANIIRLDLIHSINNIFKDVDFLILPVTSTQTPNIHSSRENDDFEEYLTDVFNVIANLTGIPSISLPSNEPTECLQIMTKFGNDANLIKLLKTISITSEK